MPSISQARQSDSVALLPTGGAISGNQILRVINAKTSDMDVTWAKPVVGYTGKIVTVTPTLNSIGAATYCITIVTGEKYNYDFVSSILQADRKEPEAKFSNVVDMFEWLERD